MKKFLLMTALVAGFLTSCSEDEYGMQSVTDSNTIAFATKQASTPKAITRSGESITSIAKFTANAVNDDNTSFFSNEGYVYDGATGVFKSAVPHYWPTTGTLSFYAINNIGSYSVDGNNVPKYTYSNWAAEKDLVAATVKAGEKEIPYPLTFRHLTSQIYVSAEAENKTEELTYKLVSVKLTAPSTGTYSFANATGGVGTWAIDNTKTSEYSYNEALPMAFKQNGQIELTSCYWNILPVTDGEIYFRIEYQVLQNSKVIGDFTGTKFKECTVNNPGLVAGKQYRYNFVLTRSTDDEIIFNSTITDWSDGASTNQTPVIPIAESTPVDLGLPSGLKWAKANLGATNETDPGLYYAWGETIGYAKDSGHVFSSANHTVSQTVDLSLDQDAAHVKLGGSWRMPTKEEFLELINGTNNSWTTLNGVNGYKFENKTDASKYIFIPASGYYNGTQLNDWGEKGDVWSSTYSWNTVSWFFAFYDGRVSVYNDHGSNGSFYGQSIRGVCE